MAQTALNVRYSVWLQDHCNRQQPADLWSEAAVAIGALHKSSLLGHMYMQAFATHWRSLLLAYGFMVVSVRNVEITS